EPKTVPFSCSYLLLFFRLRENNAVGRSLLLGEVHADALAAADAHADHGILLIGALQLVGHLGGEYAAGGADGVADGDAAAVDVDLFRVEAQIAPHGVGLAGESF